MKLIKAARGTKDIYGEDAKKYSYISKVAQEMFENYGYTLIKTPIFEETELFKRGIGEATDVVEKEMYTFKDRGDRSLTLRPENTASVVRAYLEHKMYGEEDITKVYYNGSMFRYERPQAGRQREFNQIGVEVFGEHSAILDAEVIAMGYKLLQKLGIEDLEVHINSIGSNASRTNYREKLINYLEPHEEELCEDCKTRLHRNPLRVLDCKVESCKTYTENAPSIIDSLDEKEKEHYETLKKYLTIFGVPYVEDPKLVRGLDYYSSTVFEIVTNKLGSQGTVLGGGRYDNLLMQLGEKDVPAFGFAAGVERIMMLLPDYPQNNPQVFIAWIDDTLPMALEIANILREKGIKTQVELSAKSIKSQMKKASKVNAEYVLIIGGDEMKNGTVIVKDLENRTQVEVPKDELLSYLTNKFN